MTYYDYEKYPDNTPELQVGAGCFIAFMLICIGVIIAYLFGKVVNIL